MAERVVILGAGYGGVKSALTLAEASGDTETEIILVNKHNYHQFITELHESATGHLDNNDIRVGLDEIFGDTRVKLAKDVVVMILPKEDKVVLEKETLEYDYLVVGLGSEPEYFDIPGMEQYSMTLRSLNSAKFIKTRIENNFASYKTNPSAREMLNIVVGGAGFTGIELTGELADWLPQLAEQYDLPKDAYSLICIEASSTILKGADKHLIDNSYRILQEKGVRIITGVPIEEVTGNQIKLGSGETIKTNAFIWTGGIRANNIVTQAGFTASVRGRASVNKYLQSADYPNVYLIGDNAFITAPDTGEVMGPTAQVAIQSGHVAALNILAEIKGEDPVVFHPKEMGRIVSVGRKVAVGKIGTKIKPKGRVGGLIKEAIQWKYLYSIGGLRLVAKKLLK
ncbi:MAG: NAD(P)/FAD-dependent oxidoreductase [Thermincola sp.]|jgi:NADH dehydrogenase|nr:NAD(P)/FAD-dependent oxidoreductase [Thermincola sp.]MDT3703246.1 NAD(P)/FAD-dependent oxidoreductase [Thermincola sp.]